MPKISIIMNCYNGEKYLQQSLRSVYSQTFTDWEIIFVDNCSDDQSAEIAQSYGEKLKYIKTSSHIPLYSARNLALRYINGEFVCFLDVDDLWSNKKLELQLKLFNEPEVGFAFTGTNYIDFQSEPIKKKHPTLYRGWLTHKLLKQNFIAMSSSMVRASVFDDISFSDEFNLIGDYDFWLTISTRMKGEFIPEKLFLSRIHSDSTSKKSKGLWIIEMRQLYRKFLKLHKLSYPQILGYIIKCEIGHLIKRF